jgi:hypothetical protein
LESLSVFSAEIVLGIFKTKIWTFGGIFSNFVMATLSGGVGSGRPAGTVGPQTGSYLLHLLQLSGEI